MVPDATPSADHGLDVLFMANLIEELVQRYAVDPRRIYILGSDDGAAFAARVAQSVPSKVAAVALNTLDPICSTGRWALPAFDPAVPALLIQRVKPASTPKGGAAARTRGSQDLEALETWLELNECAEQAEDAGPIEPVEYQCRRAPVVLAQAPATRGIWPRAVASKSTMRAVHDFFKGHTR
jgi:poly(3-hydroxybutyrate) depolymerase